MSGLGDFCLDDNGIVIVGELVRSEAIVGPGSQVQRRPGHQIYRYQLTGSFRRQEHRCVFQPGYLNACPEAISEKISSFRDKYTIMAIVHYLINAF